MLPAALGRLVDALGALTIEDMPALAVIGGMAVNIRLATAAEAHRATQDIDVVADGRAPTAVEILARSHEVARDGTVLVDGIEIDVIETQAVAERDLDGLADDAKLFLAGHRWALETAAPVRITTVGSALTVELPVATPAGLVAAKSHAAGYPRAARRATKHGGDVYDIYRLIEVFDVAGELRATIIQAPGALAHLIAHVLETEILANPGRAMRQMNPAAPSGLQIDQIVDVIEPFTADLRRA